MPYLDEGKSCFRCEYLGASEDVYICNKGFQNFRGSHRTRTIWTCRMALTVLLLLPLLAARRAALRTLSRRDHVLLVGAGILLALHFATWTVSLFYTSVASSVLFVSVHPMLVAALAWVLFGEAPR